MAATGEDGRLKRRLAVILASDAAGYSRLVSLDEEGTIRSFTEASRTMHALVEAHGGRVFNTAGDAILAEFGSAVLAVRAAMSINEALAAAQADRAPDRAIVMRIGIALGDVVVAEDGDLFGDGVIIASRLQTLSDEGGVCISREVLELVDTKINVDLVDLGEQRLKNLPRPVSAYRITRPAAGTAATFAPQRLQALLAYRPRGHALPLQLRSPRVITAMIGLLALAAIAWFSIRSTEVDVVLLRPAKVHLRSQGHAPLDPNEAPKPPYWWTTPTTITIMPVAFTHRTEPGRRARILAETLEVTFAGETSTYIAIYVVEITEAPCGNRWFCIKRNAGPETLEPGGSISRETMFFAPTAAAVAWTEFLVDVLSSQPPDLVITYRATVELPRGSGARTVEMSQTCRIDTAFVQADLVAKGFDPRLTKIPAHIEADCLPPKVNDPAPMPKTIRQPQ